jgi:hypothetical protein
MRLGCATKVEAVSQKWGSLPQKSRFRAICVASLRIYAEIYAKNTAVPEGLAGAVRPSSPLLPTSE